VSHVTHVSSEFQKESDSGTSMVSDSVRDDPYNEHLVPTAPEKINLYSTVRFTNNALICSNVNYPRIRLERP